MWVMSDGGKGHAPRPILIDKEQYKEKWNAIFGEKPILTGYCDVCNRKYSWCSCVSASKEVCEAIDNALGIKRKKK
jgi:hypothetical protein